MGAEADFHSLDLAKQNELLQMVASLLRPVIGEIGEVLVKEKDVVVNGSTVKKKPGFLGFLFRHPNGQVIAFAEFVHEHDRRKYREEMPIAAIHVLADDLPFVAPIVRAASNSKINGLEDSDSLKLAEMRDQELTRIFRIAYGAEADEADFKIKLQAKTLRADSTSWQSLLYFAVKDDGHGLSISPDLLDSLERLVEQLMRNALGLAGISDQRLRSAVGHLLSKLPQNFNDYIYPQNLAAIYAYVREVVPLPLAASVKQSGEVVVSGCSDDSDGKKLANRLKALHHAKEVHVNRAVGGSLKGASVYSLTVKPATYGSDQENSYPAIAKFSTIKEARDESEGLRKLQRYYSRIGKMLPPPLEVYLELEENGRAKLDDADWLKTPCISLTPDLEGEVLTEKIAKLWSFPTRRVERFSAYLKQAQIFITEIQNQSIHTTGSLTSIINVQGLLAGFFKGIKNAVVEKNRFDQFIGLTDFPETDWLSITVDEKLYEMPNPVQWMKSMLDDGNRFRWRDDLPKEPKWVIVHGDFHSGNLFISHGTDLITVLDYDHVDIGPPDEDSSRLDASFIWSVFALSDFNDKTNFNDYARHGILVAAGCHQQTICQRSLQNAPLVVTSKCTTPWGIN